MKIIALIPYWLEYQVNEFRQHKNLKKLAGKYLINYSIELLNSIKEISETIVYCSDEKINNYINKELNYKFMKRDTFLDNNDISIDTILKHFISDLKDDIDIIILLHPNSPFLNQNTVEECISNVLHNNDSAFTAFSYKKFAWFENKPLNYSLSAKTPDLSTIEPIIIEQSSLYVFTKESFLKTSKRIGKVPFIKFINHFEGHEIQTEEDFEIAELIINSGMYPKVNYGNN
ncbi:cytidylyltransferase domain-containing protein [Arcobacter sp.]|uniref:cytidylyltransferase domain-containing protein n=1 Tax=Arcobacter sp. TaxID=1872629 RepID=UPI003C752A3F